MFRVMGSKPNGTYCSFNHETREGAEIRAQVLRDLGYTDVEVTECSPRS